MAKKIEIFENTLLKLLVRRGTDADRQNVTLAEGELGYTTDTKKLFIGDGSTLGGIVVGGGAINSGGGRFIGRVTDVTTLNTAERGDIAYDVDDTKLYTLTGGSYASANNWQQIGGVYTAANNTIAVSLTNALSVGMLSAGNISSNALGNSLVIDANNKVGISTTNILTDSINSYNTLDLQLPARTSLNGLKYSWPAGGLASDLYLKTDIDGNLSWSPAFTPTSLYSASTAGQIPVGSIMPFISSSNAPVGWLQCNGQSVTTAAYSELFAVIGYNYGGSGLNFNVPNFINKAIYGVQSNPSTSTTYSIASGNNCSLSASGALYIIKAKPDQVINVSTILDYPLSGTVNGVLQVGAFNPLSGNVELGLIPTLGGITEFKNGVVSDEYGRITGEPVMKVAGVIDTVGSTAFVNTESSTKFLINPVTIANFSSNTTFTTNVSVFPLIGSLNFSGGSLTGYTNTAFSLLSSAKSVIIDSWASCKSSSPASSESLIAGASDITYINTSTPSSKTLGASEYLVNYLFSSGIGNNNCASNQVIIPLSANSDGKLTFGLRGSVQEITNNCFIRIVGFTQ